MSADATGILLAHDRWATANIIRACEGLSPEAFHRRFEMGPGSLHDTVAHIIGAIRVWTDVLCRRDLRPRLEGAGSHTPARLMELLGESAAELAAAATAAPPDQTVSRVRDGRTYTFTRAVVLVHVATHGMHHRAQCLNMLRHLGVFPLPKSSVTEWSLESGAATTSPA